MRRESGRVGRLLVGLLVATCGGELAREGGGADAGRGGAGAASGGAPAAGTGSAPQDGGADVMGEVGGVGGTAGAAGAAGGGTGGVGGVPPCAPGATGWVGFSVGAQGMRMHFASAVVGSLAFRWGGYMVGYDHGFTGWVDAYDLESLAAFRGDLVSDDEYPGEVVAAGERLFSVANGSHGPGMVLEPASWTWTLPALSDVLSTRGSATATLIDDHTIVVWGGIEYQGEALATGARFDTDSLEWLPLGTAGGPRPRGRHRAFWTGSRLLVWGGALRQGHDWMIRGDPDPDAGWLSSGDLYDPATDSWAPMSEAGGPGVREWPAVAWMGDRLLVWGGRDPATGERKGDGYEYDPATDTWAPVPGEGAPSPRGGAVAAWTGREALVWGGADDGNCKTWSCSLSDGALYDPVARRWRPAPTCGYPNHLLPEHAFWTGSEVVVVSGVTPGVAKLGGL